MSYKTQLFLTKQCVKIILSNISNEMTRLPESYVNISKGPPSGSRRMCILDIAGAKGGQASATKQLVNNCINCLVIRKGV